MKAILDGGKLDIKSTQTHWYVWELVCQRIHYIIEEGV